MTLQEQFPVDVIREMAPEDISEALLRFLVASEQSNVRLNRYNFRGDCWRAFGQEDWVEQLFMEAWGNLEGQGFLTRTTEDWYTVSSKGKIAAAGSFTDMRLATLLPKELLHPSLTPGVWKAFARGDYPAAVRDAFMEVEIAVRAAGGFPYDLVGEKLMQRAFHETDGPLTDRSRPVAERQGMMFTFVGAMKLWRNPPSHRRIPFEPKEAARVIVFASELLSIVDLREPKPESAGSPTGSGPVLTYKLGFTRNVFVLDVRVGNRGHKPIFVSEIWLCAPGRGQARCVFREHNQPDELLANGGRVYPIDLTYEAAEPFARQGSFIEMTDATGRKYTKKLAKKAREFLARDIATELRLMEESLSKAGP